MKSKNHKCLTNNEKNHLQNVKSLPCSICDASSPSDAHHIKQQRHYTAIALCKDCHQGSINGFHGQKRMWSVMKMDEIDALNKTIFNLMKGM